MKTTNKHINKRILWLALVAVSAGLLLVLATRSTNNTSSVPITASPEQITTTELPTAPEQVETSAVAANTTAQNDLLVYLIEEEKLAHDVYTVFYETYGAKVFGNILSSEQTHQSKVLTLLQARNIADPRSTEVGVFTNTQLQTLYNQLITQGMQSALEAYKVGKAIEELDIADITKQLATATDSDIVTTLEALRKGSENHLRAFNRQISRY